MKKLITHSGGMDSLACMLDGIEKWDKDNIISLGFNYGQRHFNMENAAATRFCAIYGIPRFVLSTDIAQIGGCSLVDKNIPVTTDMSQQRSTVVPMRNAIFMMYAAAFAQVHGCDVIVHGACAEDYAAYRDCRHDFFSLIETTIQAGITSPQKGSEDIGKDLHLAQFPNWLDKSKLDICIETPLIHEKKEETVKRIIAKYGVNVYVDSYSCYNGTDPQCGKCPACKERMHAFEVNNVKDPLSYEI